MASSLRLGSGAVASATRPTPLSDHPPRGKMTSDEVRLARVNDHNGSCLVEPLSVPVLDPHMHNPNSVFATRLLRVCLTSFAAFGLVVVPAVPAGAQQSADPRQESRASDPPTLRRSVRNILGGVPMTAADSMHHRVVGLLEFDSYKELVRGLTQFGDREQGTPRNAAAVDWDRGAAAKLGIRDCPPPLHVHARRR